jgi:dihydroorotate dehydrogenase
MLRWIFSARSQAGEGIEAFGLKFTNRVGLAAGYDKDGLAWRGLATLGFGHIEIGTVTPRPQPGNPKPRIFRIPEEQAVINRMGFPGRGADFVAKQLSVTNRPSPVILGVNIGKNKETPNEEAARDYLYLLEMFSPLADYLAVNVSSPNTVGLRRLQARDYLEDLLKQLSETRRRSPVSRPILVKLAPDLRDDELDDALAAIQSTGMDGVIATNTTITRDDLKSPLKHESGGLSGKPLTRKSRSMVAKIHRRTSGALPIVGVGGIMNSDDAKAILDAGASLVQLYTGLIYSGPGLGREIAETI